MRYRDREAVGQRVKTVGSTMEISKSIPGGKNHKTTIHHDKYHNGDYRTMGVTNSSEKYWSLHRWETKWKFRERRRSG